MYADDPPVRRGSLLATLVFLVAVIGGAIGAVALMGNTSSAAQATAATKRIVLRAVTATGHPAPGYRVVVDHRPAIQCEGASAAAVDDGIAFCGTSADNTVACWASAVPGRVLCLTDPWTHELASIRLSGAFPVVTAPVHRSPQGLLLHDGRSYLVRDGGAWSVVAEHPSWLGAYYERHAAGHTVYGPPHGDGIDRTRARWVVTTYLHSAGHGVTRRVDRAYYVGTVGTVGTVGAAG